MGKHVGQSKRHYDADGDPPVVTDHEVVPEGSERLHSGKDHEVAPEAVETGLGGTL